MAKTIVFCADGTWNAPAEEKDSEQPAPEGGKITNVLKLFDNLTGALTGESAHDPKEREKFARDDTGETVLAAKYIHGVGSSPDPVMRALGGVFGAGLIARIVRGFTFVSRHYEPGDAIHILGFSRGAYTARALGDMIARVGLLDPTTYDPTDKDGAYRLGIAAWCRAKNVTLALPEHVGFLQKLVDLGGALVGKTVRPQQLIADVPITSVAVWDTVGSMGIPIYERDDKRVDILRFGNNALSEKVQYGFHAMAIDEARRDFPVTRWADRERVEQVWFAGVHSDVGGGYAPDEDCKLLSDVPLSWMMRKLKDVGVAFASPLRHRLDGGTKDAVCHDSRDRPPFSMIPAVTREIAADDVFHTSIRTGWGNPPPWRPQSLIDFDFSRARWDDGAYA